MSEFVVNVTLDPQYTGGKGLGKLLEDFGLALKFISKDGAFATVRMAEEEKAVHVETTSGVLIFDARVRNGVHAGQCIPVIG